MFVKFIRTMRPTFKAMVTRKGNETHNFSVLVRSLSYIVWLEGAFEWFQKVSLRINLLGSDVGLKKWKLGFGLLYKIQTVRIRSRSFGGGRRRDEKAAFVNRGDRKNGASKATEKGETFLLWPQNCRIRRSPQGPPSQQAKASHAQLAKLSAIEEAWKDGCTGSFKSFDSEFGNFLVPVIPTLDVLRK
ncbi:uncharacterized protein LOC116249287 isoform X1 [Nymphaea colorata]|nr:uncharacterized protein LOC116249287 isoform X1 [Nymphaea colorata]